MNYKELIEKYGHIKDFIRQKRITEAIRMLEKLAGICRNSDYRNRLGNSEETYRNILKYSFEQGDDPEKEKVYTRMVKALLELADDIKEEIIAQEGLLSYYRLMDERKREGDVGEERLGHWVDKIILERESGVSSSIEIDTGGGSGIINEGPQNLFVYYWLNNRMGEKDIILAKKITQSSSFPWYYKALYVSALTLASMRKFDIEKINILFDCYQHQEPGIWQRALVGLLLIFYLNDDRLDLYPEVFQRIKSLQEGRQWNKTIESTVIQFLRAKDTEKVTEKLKKDILPEIWKIKSTLEDKLNIQELLKDKLLEDKNPEWERVFEDSPDLYNKMEELSNLQMEGSDVFLSAFALLKRFEFFNPISNWFLPFYKENENFSDVFRDVKEGFDSAGFMEGLERTAFLCNSDKYSFCLNVKHMPSMQKSMMVELFNMELQAMNEMASEDEILQKEATNRTVIVQYIQDLYRFFRLHPLKSEFQDIFELPLDFHLKGFFHKMVDDKDIIRNIGEFYFQKDHFKEALQIFLPLSETESGNELFEKAAYCYQKMGKFDEALDFYHKAELISQARTWLFNKIAYCLRKTGAYDEAIHYYRESEKLDPENLYIQTSLGQVFMEKEDFNEALKYFFKVEYLSPENNKVHRPIAWCSFVLGKNETAKKYFEKIVLKEGNKYDFMNLGHVYWSLGDKMKAIENYRLSIKISDKDFPWFAEVMKEDSRYLLNYGIQAFDIPLMLDYLRISG